MDCGMGTALGTAHLIAAFEEEQKVQYRKLKFLNLRIFNFESFIYKCTFRYLCVSSFSFSQTVVFSALSEYLHQALFTDIVLVVGHQRLRAHKVVLSSSCKFFRDAFKHHPGK